MSFISHEVAEINSKMAEWKDIANKVNELSKNFSSSNKPQSTVCYSDLPSLFFLGSLCWFDSWLFLSFHNRKINKHVWSVKQKVFENNTLEHCLNLQENCEGEIQHWLLLLSNSFHCRCAGDSGGVCQHTMQARKQCSTVTFLRNQNQGPAFPLSAQFSVISIWDIKIILSNI